MLEKIQLHTITDYMQRNGIKDKVVTRLLILYMVTYSWPDPQIFIYPRGGKYLREEIFVFSQPEKFEHLKLLYT